MDRQAVSAELLAVIVAMVDDQPCVLTLGAVPRLPAGPLMPGHRSLQAATRAWVEEQTGRRLGYLEQLYTFVDLDVAQATPRSLSGCRRKASRVTLFPSPAPSACAITPRDMPMASHIPSSFSTGDSFAGENRPACAGGKRSKGP